MLADCCQEPEKQLCFSLNILFLRSIHLFENQILQFLWVVWSLCILFISLEGLMCSHIKIAHLQLFKVKCKLKKICNTRFTSVHFPVVHLFSLTAFKILMNVYLLCKYLKQISVCSNLLVTQSCPTLCDPVDCSRAHSSVHGTLQARLLQWVSIRFSKGSYRLRIETRDHKLMLQELVFICLLVFLFAFERRTYLLRGLAILGCPQEQVSVEDKGILAHRLLAHGSHGEEFYYGGLYLGNQRKLIWYRFPSLFYWF